MRGRRSGRAAPTLVALTGLALAVGGCSSGTPSAPPGVPAPTVASPSAASSAPGALATASPAPSPIDSRVEAALALLVADGEFDRNEIEVVSVEAVTWPNAGLGCPVTGASHEPAPISGYRIVLGVGERTFTYHGATGEGPFRCLFLD